MESVTSLAWMEDDSRITIVSSTQIPHIVRRVVGQALDIPWSCVRVIKPFVGGGFPFMNNRRMECGRGKGLGGSSLINGMCYIRGNALDLDNWAQEPGLENWSPNATFSSASCAIACRCFLFTPLTISP